MQFDMIFVYNNCFSFIFTLLRFCACNTFAMGSEDSSSSSGGGGGGGGAGLEKVHFLQRHRQKFVSFAAGFAYGGTSVVVGQPLDTIKTRCRRCQKRVSKGRSLLV